MKNRHVACSLVGCVVAISAVTIARADLPPPDGTKFVGYSFTIGNAGDFKDYAFLAFRCDEKRDPLNAVEDGVNTKVGRHGGACALFAMKKDDYAAWQKSVHLTGDWTDPALEALTKDPRVQRCTGGPNITFNLPKTDPRSEVVEALRVQKLDDKGCTLTSSTSPNPVASSSSHPTTTTSASPAASSDPSPPPASRGCGGCAVESTSQSELGGVAALWVLAFGIAQRRRTARTKRSTTRA